MEYFLLTYFLLLSRPKAEQTAISPSFYILPAFCYIAVRLFSFSPFGLSPNRFLSGWHCPLHGNTARQLLPQSASGSARQFRHQCFDIAPRKQFGTDRAPCPSFRLQLCIPGYRTSWLFPPPLPGQFPLGCSHRRSAG